MLRLWEKDKRFRQINGGSTTKVTGVSKLNLAHMDLPPGVKEAYPKKSIYKAIKKSATVIVVYTRDRQRTVWKKKSGQWQRNTEAEA